MKYIEEYGIINKLVFSFLVFLFNVVERIFVNNGSRKYYKLVDFFLF